MEILSLPAVNGENPFAESCHFYGTINSIFQLEESVQVSASQESRAAEPGERKRLARLWGPSILAWHLFGLTASHSIFHERKLVVDKPKAFCLARRCEPGNNNKPCVDPCDECLPIVVVRTRRESRPPFTIFFRYLCSLPSWWNMKPPCAVNGWVEELSD